jgi:hypothetical protein
VSLSQKAQIFKPQDGLLKSLLKYSSNQGKEVTQVLATIPPVFYNEPFSSEGRQSK